jgi:hypothetical protein
MGRGGPEKGSKVFRDSFAGRSWARFSAGGRTIPEKQKGGRWAALRRRLVFSSKEDDHLTVVTVMMVVVPPPPGLTVMVVVMTMVMMAMGRGSLDRCGERAGGNEDGDEA